MLGSRSVHEQVGPCRPLPFLWPPTALAGKGQWARGLSQPRGVGELRIPRLHALKKPWDFKGGDGLSSLPTPGGKSGLAELISAWEGKCQISLKIRCFRERMPDLKRVSALMVIWPSLSTATAIARLGVSR